MPHEDPGTTHSYAESSHHTAADLEGLNREVVAVAVREAIASEDDDANGITDDVIRQLSICGGRVAVHLAMHVGGADDITRIESAITGRLRMLGASDVSVVIRRPDLPKAPRTHAPRDPWADRVRLETVRHVVAVGAGKGGVGKSTVAVNLALSLAREGLRVGLLDADIYGPSIPILLGIEDGAARARMSPEKQIIPLEAHGLPLVSFGFFLGEGSPAIWRGPMASKAVKQFARGVAWPELDILIVDLPPGTGDVPLSLAQGIELSGAVVVTQPARVAVAEARKAVRMFATLDVPVLGVVENMTGAFGGGAGQSVCAELGVSFLGELPFDAEIVREGDIGTPTMVARPDSASAASFDTIAQQIAEALGWHRVAPPLRTTRRLGA
jgi:ATP-binding protein involved in chromosome partitioning